MVLNQIELLGVKILNEIAKCHSLICSELTNNIRIFEVQ